MQALKRSCLKANLLGNWKWQSSFPILISLSLDAGGQASTITHCFKYHFLLINIITTCHNSMHPAMCRMHLFNIHVRVVYNIFSFNTDIITTKCRHNFFPVYFCNSFLYNNNNCVILVFVLFSFRVSYQCSCPYLSCILFCIIIIRCFIIYMS